MANDTSTLQCFGVRWVGDRGSGFKLLRRAHSTAEAELCKAHASANFRCSPELVQWLSVLAFSSAL